LIDSGDAPSGPRCVHSCPTEAIKHYCLEPAEMEQKIKDEKLEILLPELNTKPHVFYKNYHLFNKAFVAGGFLKGGECVKGADARLTGNGIDERQATDCFGDFKFDNLCPGDYTLYSDDKAVRKVTVPEVGATDTIAFNNNSQNLGNIEL
jgi:ferredoxin